MEEVCFHYSAVYTGILTEIRQFDLKCLSITSFSTLYTDIKMETSELQI